MIFTGCLLNYTNKLRIFFVACNKTKDMTSCTRQDYHAFFFSHFDIISDVPYHTRSVTRFRFFKLSKLQYHYSNIIISSRIFNLLLRFEFLPHLFPTFRKSSEKIICAIYRVHSKFFDNKTLRFEKFKNHARERWRILHLEARFQ